MKKKQQQGGLLVQPAKQGATQAKQQQQQQQGEVSGNGAARGTAAPAVAAAAAAAAESEAPTTTELHRQQKQDVEARPLSRASSDDANVCTGGGARACVRACVRARVQVGPFCGKTCLLLICGSYKRRPQCRPSPAKQQHTPRSGCALHLGGGGTRGHVRSQHERHCLLLH
jgi:hypothetical protein